MTTPGTLLARRDGKKGWTLNVTTTHRLISTTRHHATFLDAVNEVTQQVTVKGTMKNEERAAQFAEMLEGAVASCLWSTTPSVSDDAQLDLVECADHYDISPEEVTKLRGTIAHHLRGFFNENYIALATVTKRDDYDWQAAGHDFWLTSQGHGAGYWDRGLEELGDTLTDASQGYDDIIDLYLDDELTSLMVDSYNITEFNTTLEGK